MDSIVSTQLGQAEQRLNQAKNELCKPFEDVVPYSVCNGANDAIVHYLRSFLLFNKKTLPESNAVHDLLRECRSLDARFEELHLAPFYHPTDTEDIWMNMDTAQDFMKMAEKTRQFVQDRGLTA